MTANSSPMKDASAWPASSRGRVLWLRNQVGFWEARFRSCQPESQMGLLYMTSKSPRAQEEANAKRPERRPLGWPVPLYNHNHNHR